MSRRTRKEILVSWLPTTHGATPLLTVLEHPSYRIDELVLCHRQPEVDPKHAEVLATTIETLAARCPSLGVTPMPWRSKAAPTDHAKILEFSKQVLRGIREREPEARINIHLSPGTKAMHAAWLTLAHGSFIGGEVRLLQTSEEKHQKRGAEPVEEVRLPQETWAHIVRSAAQVTSSEGSDLDLWDLPNLKSSSAKATIQQIDRWAPLRAPIFLIGERGTGKTTLAQIIRARSPFRAIDDARKPKDTKPWPVVVCGQFRANPQLARSELFGHTKGAFTGADAERKGILEQVEGDTLFLDEIADLDRGTQRLLIAAIEGRDYYRLGNETKSYKANFRLIVATNRPLDGLLLDPSAGDAAHGIDADFFDRISTFIVRIPPLRERREDLPDIWRTMLRTAAERASLDRDAVSVIERDRSVLEALSEHHLPGNLRDIQRAAWRAVASIHAHESRAQVTRAAIDGLELPFTVTGGASGHLPSDIDAYLAAESRRIFEAALAAADGSQSEAAKRIGLARKTFASRYKRLFD